MLYARGPARPRRRSDAPDGARDGDPVDRDWSRPCPSSRPAGLDQDPTWSPRGELVPLHPQRPDERRHRPLHRRLRLPRRPPPRPTYARIQEVSSPELLRWRFAALRGLPSLTRFRPPGSRASGRQRGSGSSRSLARDFWSGPSTRSTGSAESRPRTPGSAAPGTVREGSWACWRTGGAEVDGGGGADPVVLRRRRKRPAATWLSRSPPPSVARQSPAEPSTRPSGSVSTWVLPPGPGGAPAGGIMQELTGCKKPHPSTTARCGLRASAVAEGDSRRLDGRSSSSPWCPGGHVSVHAGRSPTPGPLRGTN